MKISKLERELSPNPDKLRRRKRIAMKREHRRK